MKPQEHNSTTKPTTFVLQGGDSSKMPRAGRGSLHYNFARLAKDVLEVLALDEPDDDGLEKIESNTVVLANSNDNTARPLDIFRREQTKEPEKEILKNTESNTVVLANGNDKTTAGPFTIFRREQTKEIQVDDEDDDEDDECLWDKLWEYILKDDHLDEDPNEEDVPPGSQSDHRRGFRLRIWEGDGDDDEECSTSDEEDSFEDEDDPASSFGLDKWEGCFDGNTNDAESISLGGTEASSFSQDETSTTEEIEEIKGPTTLLKHRLVAKPKNDTGANDHQEKADKVIDSVDKSSTERNRRKRSNLSSRVFILVKPRKGSKDTKEKAPSEEDGGPGKPKRSSKTSRLFFPEKTKENAKVQGQEGSVLKSKDSPSAEQLIEAAEQKWASLTSRLFTLSHLQHETTDEKTNAVNSADQKKANRASRLVIKGKPKKDTQADEQEHCVIDSKDLRSDNQQNEPAGVKWERVSSRLLMQAHPKTGTNGHDQENGLVNSVDAPSDEQGSGPFEPTWASLSSQLLILTTNENEQEISLIVRSNEDKGPAESKWASLSARLMNMAKPKLDASEQERELSPVDSNDLLSNKESEVAECNRSIISFRQLSLCKDTEQHQAGVPDEHREQLRRKRTIALPRMLPIRRKEKSPSLLEKPVNEDCGPTFLFTNLLGTHPSPIDGGRESGSSNATVAGSWMSDSFVETASNCVGTAVGKLITGSSGETANNTPNGKLSEEEVPESIILKTPKLALLKSKMWHPRPPKVLAGGDEDIMNEEVDDKIEKDENDHKMALLRKRWADMSKGKNCSYTNKKMSIGIEIRDADGNVAKKIWLHSRRNDCMIEVTDWDATDNTISQGFLSRPEAEKIEGWLKEKKRRRGWTLKKQQRDPPVVETPSS